MTTSHQIDAQSGHDPAQRRAVVERFRRSDRWGPLEYLFWCLPVLAYFLFPGNYLLLSQIAITSLFALSLDLIFGYAGIISLGHAAFFGVGAYTAGLLAVVAVCAHLLYGQRLFPSDAYGWLVLACLAVISHAGGQGLLSYALGTLPSMFSSLVIFLEAVAAAALAWLVLGEAGASLQVLGGGALLFGIWLARPRA